LAKILSSAFSVLVVASLLAAQSKAPAVAGKTPADFSRGKSMGSPSAPVTLEIFGDFQCPNCRVFYLAITQKVITNYVTPGKVYLVHRDFPIPSLHPNARLAARWANAAALAGKFAETEKALYEAQDSWATSGKIEPVLSTVLSAADMKKIRDILAANSAQIDAAIQSDITLANSRGVDGTPTVFVTHRGQTQMLPQGGVSYALLGQLLDYYLAH
jgi:protein-disulfide isomerase